MSDVDPGVETRLRERIEEVLPPDRQLVPEETDDVAAAVEADAVTATRYTDESGYDAISILALWWERHNVAALVDRYGGEWEIKLTGDVDLDQFQAAADMVAEQDHAERVGPDRLRMDDGTTRELDLDE